MDAAKYDALIVRLEALAARRPIAYTARVLAVALSGFAILTLALGFALVGTALVIGLIVILVAAHAAAVVAPLFKVLILLVVPAWAMIKASVTLLFARFTEPEGREVTRAEAPPLFATLEGLRRKLRGPPVHAVLLVNQVNAAIVQHPRLGLFGWEKNILILGMPLLQILSEEEALAVVAHEYGHLSGHHSRIGGFIYRLRATWSRLHELSQQWRDWGSRLVARLFNWYAPYFNAYTFVLARQNEYLADQTAVEAAGRLAMATALIKSAIAGVFEASEFSAALDRRVAIEPEPPASRTAFWQASIRGAMLDGRGAGLLETVRQRKTDHFDTHPALSDRLAAIGITPGNEMPERFVPAEVPAAAAWLGPSVEQVQAEFDNLWREVVEEKWHERHNYLTEARRRLAELESLTGLTPDQQWERVQALEALHSEADVLPLLDAILAVNPDHHQARFRRGSLSLERGNEAGIADLETVMAGDRDAILPACELAWRFYAGRDARRAGEYEKRWHERSAALERMASQSKRVSVDDDLAPPDLSDEAVAAIAAALRSRARSIRRAYLMRRSLDVGLHDYVLAVVSWPFARRSSIAEAMHHLAETPVPERMLIVPFSRQNRKAFRKKFRRSGVKPLAF